jgi:hypothetical protein
LDDNFVLGGEGRILAEIDASALAIGMWLDDIEGTAFSLVECLEIPREDPSLRVELIQFRHMCPRLIEIDSKQILPTQFAATGEVIDLLVALESFDELLGNVGIDPHQKDIVVLILLVVELVVEVLVDQVVDY